MSASLAPFPPILNLAPGGAAPIGGSSPFAMRLPSFTPEVETEVAPTLRQAREALQDLVYLVIDDERFVCSIATQTWRNTFGATGKRDDQGEIPLYNCSIQDLEIERGSKDPKFSSAESIADLAIEKIRAGVEGKLNPVIVVQFDNTLENGVFGKDVCRVLKEKMRASKMDFIGIGFSGDADAKDAKADFLASGASLAFSKPTPMQDVISELVRYRLNSSHNS